MALIQCLNELRKLLQHILYTRESFSLTNTTGAVGMSFAPVMIRTMLAQGKSAEEMLSVVHRLRDMGCGEHGYEEVLYGLLRRGNHGDVYSTLRCMHSLVR